MMLTHSLILTLADSPALVEAWESVGVKGSWKGWEEES